MYKVQGGQITRTLCLLAHGEIHTETLNPKP